MEQATDKKKINFKAIDRLLLEIRSCYSGSAINIAAIQKALEPNIVNYVKSNPYLKSYRDNKVMMSYF